jgi:ferrous iron transport protein A
MAVLSIIELKPGEKAKLIGFNTNEKAYRHKLLAMGLIPGTIFLLKRIAPLGDPLEIQVRGFALTLRKSEAGCLQVERVPACTP